ncbi:MAG: carbohydrate-binding domain-containing protein, partial [Duncaniella sp.]|nr:carbohydrate-binding domain-containing protein [Duncaniella sp.]
MTEMPGMGGPGMGGMGSDDSSAPGFDHVITPWDGTKADDGANDKIDSSNSDIYHEANTFTEKVNVVYSGSSATVTVSDGSKVLYRTDGAYVTIDMLTNSVKNVEITASGVSGDGQLKIYGDKKFKLTLNGLDLTSSRGPAINDQCKKRVFVHLADGTTNTLTDCAKYSTEPYYLTATGETDEDRKGCFFSEGNMIFSGTGVLQVAGRYKHGIVTDGYMWMRPGVTLVVTEAAKNAVHVKGDATDNIGLHMEGGLLYTNVSSTAGKGIKTDLHAEILGGRLLLNQSGDATYDEGDQDTSSAAGIKTDGNVIISGGTHVIKSTGTGGKGINADGTLLISGGETTITTTGGCYYKSAGLTSSPKGVKADGNIDITGGTLNI